MKCCDSHSSLLLCLHYAPIQYTTLQRERAATVASDVAAGWQCVAVLVAAAQAVTADSDVTAHTPATVTQTAVTKTAPICHAVQLHPRFSQHTRDPITGPYRSGEPLSFEHTVATATSSGTVQMWDLAYSARIPRCSLQCCSSGAVRCISFSASGTTLVSGSDSGSVQLWHVAEGYMLYSYSMGYAAPAIMGISYSPSGRSAIIYIYIYV
jgi:WD40 repeat protein